MNLVIDWGNSTLKTGWFEGAGLMDAGRYSSVDELLADIAQRPFAHGIVSSTSRPASDIREGLGSLSDKLLVLDGHTPVPVRKHYDTPYTLGADRIAAAVGAVTLFPDQHCLVLDLGTCLTADLVSKEGIFEGGLISPGLRMRFRAMHEQTARLPLLNLEQGLVLDDQQWPALTATNTHQAMMSGVLNGLSLEMNGIIDYYRRERPGLVVVLCGGDGLTFESRLKPPIFAVSELVLIGLNRILQYNVENL
ncbi:type III pantothenate kinase [Spirosoma lacussanchae]|uniref:type III pantothenate kinase n=1 Tax=Spirosoma lacussanchae TaxID=1884249 RepID=UPI001107F2EB|nr:type III pantothenate kinase [Spirosoma lacussanchae]